MSPQKTRKYLMNCEFSKPTIAAQKVIYRFFQLSFKSNIYPWDLERDQLCSTYAKSSKKLNEVFVFRGFYVCTKWMITNNTQSFNLAFCKPVIQVAIIWKLLKQLHCVKIVRIWSYSEFCEISKNTFFTEHVCTTASYSVQFNSDIKESSLPQTFAN